MFKVYYKDTRTEPMASFWCIFLNFTVSIVNFEWVNAGWESTSLIPGTYEELIQR